MAAPFARRAEELEWQRVKAKVLNTETGNVRSHSFYIVVEPVIKITVHFEEQTPSLQTAILEFCHS